MNLNDFIHPEDSSTLQALKSVPIFPTLMEKFLQYGFEQLMWSENITTNIRLSENQIPHLYRRLPPICEKLGIAVPELYLNQSVIPNAYTAGSIKPYIVITRGLINRLNEDELEAALAHECGHILCNHVLYSMVAEVVFSMGEELMESLGIIGSVALMPVKSALSKWKRASELSADRIATIITSASTLSKTLARIDMPRSLVEKLNYEEWAKQGADFEAQKLGSTKDKAIRMFSNSGLDHPYSPVRAYEAFRWENSDLGKYMKDNIQNIMAIPTCPKCGSVIDLNWQFCQICGNKLN